MACRMTQLRGGLTAAAIGLALAGAASAEPAVWTVRDADTTVHLLGTIHLLAPGTDWRSEAIDEAIGGADTLWLEIDILRDTSATLAMITRGTSPDRPLRELLSAADYAEVEAAAAAAGVPMSSIEKLRPWLASITLSLAMIRTLGYDQAGVDLALAREAAARGIPVRAFETGAEQIELLAGFDEATEVAFLMEAVRASEEELDLFGRMFEAWLAGNAAILEDLLVESVALAHPAIADALLAARNRAWAERFEEIMAEPGERMVAVGAGHLVGPDDLPGLLAARGWDVDRVE